MAEPVSSLRAIPQLKESFSSFSHLQLREGFGKLAQLGGDVIAFGISAFGGYLIAEVLQNKNLKTYQKIIPALGYVLGIVVTLPLAIAIVAGAAVLIPPFVFAASCVSVVRDIATYIEERTERNNLRKELISKVDLMKKIDKQKLPEQSVEIISKYMEDQDNIYIKLYEARRNIITNGKLGVAKKREKVLAMNKIIEDFYLANRDTGSERGQQLKALSQRLEEIDLPELSKELVSYGAICHEFEHLGLKRYIKNSIEVYRFTHEKVHSQDLPGNIKGKYINLKGKYINLKGKYINLIEGGKIKSEDLQLLYSHIGNHYINQTPMQQITLQDDVLIEKCKLSNISQARITTIIEYNVEPRRVYDSLMQCCEMLPNLLKDDPEKDHKIELFEKFRLSFVNPPYAWQKDWEACKEVLINRPFIADLDTELSKINAMNSAFDKLDIDNNIKSQVKEHRTQTLTQYTNSYQTDFPVPKMDYKLNENDLLHRAGIKPKVKNVINSADKKFEKHLSNLKDKVLRKITRDKNVTDENTLDGTQKVNSTVKKEILNDFNERYEGIFNVVEKKERLNFLVKSVPRRLTNVFLSIGVALSSLATSILIPAVASPAAPAAAAAATAIGVLSTTLTVASVANSAQLVYKNLKGVYKLSSTKDSLSKGVIPDPLFDAKVQKSGKKRIAKQNKKPLLLSKELQKADPSHENMGPSASHSKEDSPIRGNKP